MNKVVLSIIIVLSTLFASAQKGIEFQHKSFDEVCEMAAKQNKLVFVDVYTQWCGPCLAMVEEVFSLASVGDEMNKHFISVKIDVSNNNDLRNWGDLIKNKTKSCLIVLGAKFNEKNFFIDAVFYPVCGSCVFRSF